MSEDIGTEATDDDDDDTNDEEADEGFLTDCRPKCSILYN